MFEGKNGIFPLVAEECVIGEGSDQTLLDKLNTHHSSSPFFMPSSRASSTFQIAHYAGTVRYSIGGFLEKNKDPLHQDLLLTMQVRKTFY